MILLHPFSDVCYAHSSWRVFSFPLILNFKSTSYSGNSNHFIWQKKNIKNPLSLLTLLCFWIQILRCDSGTSYTLERCQLKICDFYSMHDRPELNFQCQEMRWQNWLLQRLYATLENLYIMRLAFANLHFVKLANVTLIMIS